MKSPVSAIILDFSQKAHNATAYQISTKSAINGWVIDNSANFPGPFPGAPLTRMDRARSCMDKFWINIGQSSSLKSLF